MEQEPEPKPQADDRLEPERDRREPNDKSSGQGAASALATWREIERKRLDSDLPDADRVRNGA